MGFYCQLCQPTPGNGLNTAFCDSGNCQTAFSFCQTTVSRRRKWIYNAYVYKVSEIKRKTDTSITKPLLSLWQRKERGHMEKQKYQMDLSFLENYDNSTRNYQPFDLLATPKCMSLMVMCSKKPEPAT